MDRLIDFFLEKESVSLKVVDSSSEEDYPYSRLLDLFRRSITFFESKKVTVKEPVILLMDNSIEFVLFALYASMKGIKIVPVDFRMPPENVKNIADRFGVSTVITNRSVKDLEGLKIIHFSTEGLSNYALGVITVSSDPDEVFLILTTSGSTGKPKPIALSQKTKVRRAFVTAVELYDLKEDEVVLTSTPLFHSLGFRLATLPFYLGCRGVIMRRFSPEMWLSTIYREKVSFTISVSSQLEAVTQILEKEEWNLSSLRCLVSSSSLLEERTKLKLLDLVKAELHEIYGTSETSTATDIDLRENKERIGSVGKPLEGVDLKIIDDEGRELPPRRVGEIAVRTELIFSGYYLMKEETEKAFTEDGYFLTGDLGFKDEEGFLYFKGRKKFVYKVGGINVYPEDVERVILRFPGVKACGVVGVKARNLGTKLVAFLVPRSDINVAELRKFCVKHLLPYQVPAEFLLTENLPLTPTGKLDRKRLQEEVRQ